MAFISLRRSRNTRSYYLVESYRDDHGRSRKRTVCYLGREQDETDTLEKALSHWQRIERATSRELRSTLSKRSQTAHARLVQARERICLLKAYIAKARQAEAGRLEHRRRQEAAEENRRQQAEQAQLWQAIERLHRSNSADDVKAAKQAFRSLALRLHPDQGGTHEAFVRLKDVYDRAMASWRIRST